jgi:hypothetical protein
MQRVRGAFVAGVKPAYDDPLEPTTEAAGYFNKDPLLHPTQYTPDFGNHIQEELAQLVEAFGFTLKDASDQQLADAIGPALKGVRRQVPTSSFVNVLTGGFVHGTLGQARTLTAGSTCIVPLPQLEVGARIGAIRAFALETDPVAPPDEGVVELVRQTGSDYWVVVASLQGWNATYGPGAYGALSTTFAAHTVLADTSYYFQLSTPGPWTGGLFAVGAVEYTVDLHGVDTVP